MKNVRMNISHFHFISFNLKTFGKIATLLINLACINFVLEEALHMRNLYLVSNSNKLLQL